MDSSTLRLPIRGLNPKSPICVTPNDSMLDVIKKMRDHKIGCVCVSKGKNLLGIVTERDVLTKIVGGKLDLAVTNVEEVMTHNPEYLYEEDQIAFALNRMHMGGFRHIPLTDHEGRPTGVISVRDIAKYLVQSLSITD